MLWQGRPRMWALRLPERVLSSGSRLMLVLVLVLVLGVGGVGGRLWLVVEMMLLLVMMLGMSRMGCGLSSRLLLIPADWLMRHSGWLFFLGWDPRAEVTGVGSGLGGGGDEGGWTRGTM